MNSNLQNFIQPVFIGDRFKHHALPMDALASIVAYQDLIRAIAKKIYLHANPGRTRLPKGFQDKFQLDLSKIEPGSAIAILSREVDNVEDYQADEFTQARDRINEFIVGVSEGKQVSNEIFDGKIIPLFDFFGKDLKEDEVIELRLPSTIPIDLPETQTACYTKKVRSRILAISKETYQGICVLHGAISGFESSKKVFYFILDDGTLITGSLPSNFDSIIQQYSLAYGKKDHEFFSCNYIWRGKVFTRRNSCSN